MIRSAKSTIKLTRPELFCLTFNNKKKSTTNTAPAMKSGINVRLSSKAKIKLLADFRSTFSHNSLLLCRNQTNLTIPVSFSTHYEGSDKHPLHFTIEKTNSQVYRRYIIGINFLYAHINFSPCRVFFAIIYCFYLPEYLQDLFHSRSLKEVLYPPSKRHFSKLV